MTDNSDFNLVFRFEKQDISSCITQAYIEMSTHCNLSCRSCVRNSIVNFKKTHFSPAMMRKILPMLKKLQLERIVLLGFGEALCNPDIKYLLKSLRTLKTRIVLVTNAAFLSEEMSTYLIGLPLDEIYVSWDDDIEGDATINRQGIQAGVFRRNIEFLLKLKKSSLDDSPHVGMELVATKSNYQLIPQAIAYGHSVGIDKFIVSNIFPYYKNMGNEILYNIGSKPVINLKKYLQREIKHYNVVIANQSVDITRRCPFIEKGTIFITVNGEVSPCLELAYTHPAFYFGSDRMHNRFIVGNMMNQTIQSIWDNKQFTEFRNNFATYDYSDCSFCYQPDRCGMRTLESVDCYCNTTPCGECLWAKDIVLCP
jgi:MoaA/NifB/PqqE/SkfB family radical SAM enzyme